MLFILPLIYNFKIGLLSYIFIMFPWNLLVLYYVYSQEFLVCSLRFLAIAYFPCLILFIFSFFLCNFFIVYLQSVFGFKMNRLIIFHFLSFLFFNFIISKLIISISLFFFMFTFVTYTFLLTFVIFKKNYTIIYTYLF